MRKLIFVSIALATLIASGSLLFADLKIEQVSNGFPGSERKSGEKILTKQELLIKGDKLKITNLEEPVVCIVRLDKQLIWEINTQEKQYVERQFSYFTKLKKNRLAQRILEVKQLNAIKDQKEREETAKKLGYRVNEDGTVDDTIISAAEKTGEKKKIGDYECEHLLIKENDRVIFDMWVTQQVKVSESMIKFYEELGAFSKETLTKLREVKDFPVELKMDLDTGTITFKIEAAVSKITETAEIDDKEFELPEGLKKIKEISGDGEKELGIVPCLICGKEVDLQQEKTVFRYVHKGLLYIFCSQEHRTEFIKLLLKYGNTDFLKNFPQK